jgi:geranylgeranyl diphosphate synthase type I
MPAAAALELVHNYSLIHDDVQDDDPVRRHRPSVWKIWGKPQAINAGTALRIIAGLSLYGLIDKGIGSSVVMAAQALLDRTTLRLLEGQYMDIDFESRTDIKADEYIEMVSGKTGALIACSIEMGALIAGGVSDTAPFGEFGEAMGLAFQIRDDWLGIWGDPDQTGKGRGNDILRKKKSLPVVEAFSRAGAPALKKMRSIYDKPELGADDVLSVMNIMDDLKINEIVQARVDHDCEKAEGLAKKLFIGSARDELCDLLKFLSRREH